MGSSSDSQQDLKLRTKAFAVRVVRLIRALPRDIASQVMGKQLLRSATSVGANYRAARRARSSAEFVAKLGIVEEEVDESAYWLELLVETETVPRDKLAQLMAECEELTAIIVSCIRTAKRSRKSEARSRK